MLVSLALRCYAWFRVSLRFVPTIAAKAAENMHIVAIGWLYVALMMAITETSIVAGVLTLVFYGVLPVAIILYISGSKQRKRKREAEQVAMRATAEQQTDTAKKEEIN